MVLPGPQGRLLKEDLSAAGSIRRIATDKVVICAGVEAVKWTFRSDEILSLE